MLDFPINRFSFHNYVNARNNKKVTFNLLNMESSSNMEVGGMEEETVGKQVFHSLLSHGWDKMQNYI